MKITYGVQEDVLSGYTVTTDGVDKDHDITLTNTHHPNNEKVWFSKQSLGGQELRRRNDEAHRNVGRYDEKPSPSRRGLPTAASGASHWNRAPTR